MNPARKQWSLNRLCVKDERDNKVGFAGRDNREPTGYTPSNVRFRHINFTGHASVSL